MKNNPRLLRSPLSPQDPNVYRPNKKYKTCVTLHSKNVKNFPDNQFAQMPNDHQNISNSTILFLDLSDNRITSDHLQHLGQNLISLNLSNNPLKTCCLPALPKLRSLNLDNCCISSLQGLPFFPNLKKLSLYGNPILNFSGCPMLPKLESINILKFPPKMIIAAFGSLYLHTINRKKLSIEQVKSAFELSPLVGISLRKGREVIELDSPEDETKASAAFLTVDLREYIEKNNIEADPKLEIVSDGENFVLHCPFEAYSYKWYRHSFPDKGSEWKPIKFEGRDLPITMAIRLHIVRCQIQLPGGKCFYVYNDETIGKGPVDLSLPYPIFPMITGTPIEGSMIAILPMPVPCRIVWTKGSETLDKDKTSLVIPHSAVGTAIACVLQPYCPKFPNIIFSAIFTTTDIVAPLKPMVAGIQFPEVIIECQSFFFTRTMLPENEGPSEITVERSFTPSSEWVLCKTITPDKLKYKPTSNDIGHFLRISYMPITADGTKGNTYYFYSQSRVIPTTPIFYNALVGGVGKVNFPLIALADYAGGKKGKCTYDWYFSKRPIDTTTGPSKRLQKVAHNTQFFTPPPNFGEGYVAVQMVPVRDDEIIGDPVFVSIEQPLQIEDPPKPLDVPKEAIVGQRISFENPVDFLLSKTSGYFGFDFYKTSKTYTPREKHIGRILRVVTKKSDVVIGEIKPANPKIISVKIDADRWQAGSMASLYITHKNCDPDKIEILWLRQNSSFQKAVAINVPVYEITGEDVGYALQVVVTPFNTEHERLKSFYSNISPYIKSEEKINLKIVGPLVEGKEITINATKEVESVTWYQKLGKNDFNEIGHEKVLILSSNEIGKYIRASVLLANGIVVNTTTKECVVPSKPSAEVVLPSRVFEGDLITPEITYSGGSEGASLKRWYRETEQGGWEFVKESPTYQVTTDDIECLIKFVYTPIRLDSKRGNEIEVECGPVEAMLPAVSNVKLFQNDKGYIEVSGQYKGGIEGQSMIVWRAFDENGVAQNIGKTMEKEMIPTDIFAGKLVEAGYVPIREDGMGGHPVMSNQILVEPLPIVETAEILVRKGQIIAGNPMRCNATVPQKCTALYQWYIGDGSNWQMIDGAEEAQFVPTNEEVGYYILCSIIAVNEKGWKSPPFAAATSKTLEPAAEDLKITSTSNVITTGMVLSTNIKFEDLDKIEVVWQRESKTKWRDVHADHDYIVSCNDVGYRIRCVDSTGRVSEPTQIVDADSQLSSYIKAILRTSNMKFVGIPKLGQTIWYAAVSPIGVSLESDGKKKKQSKWNLVKAEAVEGTVDEMVLWMDPSSKFHIIPSLANDARLESLVKKENVRDFVVSVIWGIKKSSQK